MRPLLYLAAFLTALAHVLPSSALFTSNLNSGSDNNVAFFSNNTIANGTLPTANLTAQTPQNFTCDNCIGYKSLLVQCLRDVPQNITTTLNDVELPLYRCLCNQTDFYMSFSNCEAGCAGKTVKSVDAFNSQCQLILSDNPPPMPTSPSGTVLVGPYASKLSDLPTTLNPTALFGGPNATATAATSSAPVAAAIPIAIAWMLVLMVLMTAIAV